MSPAERILVIILRTIAVAASLAVVPGSWTSRRVTQSPSSGSPTPRSPGFGPTKTAKNRQWATGALQAAS
jgi:hypothetical protein